MADAFELMATLTTVARQLRTALDQEFAPLGITAQQAGTLLHIANGVTNARELRGAMNLDTASMTRLLDRLAHKNLVERQPGDGDRRTVAIVLLAPGTALVPHIPPVFAQIAARISNAVPPEELAVATSVLRLIGVTLPTG